MALKDLQLEETAVEREALLARAASTAPTQPDSGCAPTAAAGPSRSSTSLSTPAPDSSPAAPISSPPSGDVWLHRSVSTDATAGSALAPGLGKGFVRSATLEPVAAGGASQRQQALLLRLREKEEVVHRLKMRIAQLEQSEARSQDGQTRLRAELDAKSTTIAHLMTQLHKARIHNARLREQCGLPPEPAETPAADALDSASPALPSMAGAESPGPSPLGPSPPKLVHRAAQRAHSTPPGRQSPRSSSPHSSSPHSSSPHSPSPRGSSSALSPRPPPPGADRPPVRRNLRRASGSGQPVLRCEVTPSHRASAPSLSPASAERLRSRPAPPRQRHATAPSASTLGACGVQGPPAAESVLLLRRRGRIVPPIANPPRLGLGPTSITTATESPPASAPRT